MDDITHHIPDDCLLAYSAGTLPEAFALMVAAHLTLCDSCRAAVAAYDSIGGALVEDSAAPLDADSLNATLARIERPRPAEPERLSCAVLPAPLTDYIGGDISAVRWRPVGLGVRQAILPTSGKATARLLYIPAGASVPDHGHNGQELTMVLQGAFSDAGDRFARGDVETADESLEHTPVADPGADCICLAVTDAPLRFRGLLPRLIQPLLRI
ncbi:MAG: ChrR family anti-sigma-E factor [Pseudooceanicola sp.]|nr:ChrR family anti-sigma-E factor [Pseudooceanicola sp.]